MSDNNASAAKRLLIITGPQGSGNHIFSRVFSMHPAVRGWEQLKDQYWVPSDEETFAEYWVHPDRLTPAVFDGADYFLANVSVPFFYDGVRQTPHIREVADRARSFGIDVSIAIVVRDATINSAQQQRVGGAVTLPQAQEYYRKYLLYSEHQIYFLDHEALFLWGEYYVNRMAHDMEFPVDTDRCLTLLDHNPNRKYVTAVDDHWLDEEIRAGRRPFQQRDNSEIQPGPID
jgi:hypothetical protein